MRSGRDPLRSPEVLQSPEVGRRRDRSSPSVAASESRERDEESFPHLSTSGTVSRGWRWNRRGNFGSRSSKWA
jgi:hypothetical protein